MRKLINIMMYACICICALLIFKSDVYASDFDSEFGNIEAGKEYGLVSRYTYADGTVDDYIKSLKMFSMPYVYIDSMESTSKVYACFFRYKIMQGSYFAGYTFFSSDSFTLNCKVRASHDSDSVSKALKPSSFTYNSKNFYYVDVFLASTHGGSSDYLSGFYSVGKLNTNETYDVKIDQYDSSFTMNILHSELAKLLIDGYSDYTSNDDGQGGFSDGQPDETLGHFKIKSNKMKVINVDEHQHEHNQLTFMNETDTGVNITASNISAQYKIEGYLTEDNGETWKNHYTTPIYTASGQDFIHGKSNNQTNIYICELTPKFIEFCNHIYPISEREPFNNRKYVGKISVFVRPYHVVDGQLKYGAWTKCYARFKGSHSESGHEDGGYDNNEDSDNDTDNNYDDNNDDNYNDDGEAGVGYDDDSAEDSADSKNNDNGGSGGGSSDVSFDSIKELVNQIGNVPLLIKKVFSFLPSWCLTLIATAFVMFVILMLVKVIRG